MNKVNSVDKIESYLQKEMYKDKFNNRNLQTESYKQKLLSRNFQAEIYKQIFTNRTTEILEEKFKRFDG